MSLSVASLGVQSYCFRNFKTNREVIERVKACGVSAVELCAVHADFKDESGFDRIIAEYRDQGIKLLSIGVQGFANNEANETKYFEFVKRAGVKIMSVDFDLATTPDCIRTAEKLAERYDVRLAIHNHGGWHWLGSAMMLDKVFKNTSPRIGLCLDTAWAMNAHEDPIAMIERFGQRLYGLHVKDFVFDRAGNNKDVVVGTGNLDLLRMKEALKKVGFNGYWVLEYEEDADNPVPALQKCVKQMAKVF